MQVPPKTASCDPEVMSPRQRMIDIPVRASTTGLRFLARLVPKDESSEESLLKVVRILAENLGSSARNPKWTSYGALEIDVFAKGEADFETLLAAIEPLAKVEFTRNLDEVPKHLEKRRAIELAMSYFNQERYWESHEILESVWRISDGDEKGLLQGMILVDAAFVHVQKKEPDVAMGVLRRAVKQLEWKDRRYNGVDIQAIREKTRKIIDDGKFEIFRISQRREG